MARALIESLILFSVPFILFAFVLLTRRQRVLERSIWQDKASLLTMIGLILAILGLLWFGLNSHQSGTYIPPHMENGRFVPGQFK
jgi:multisubunit Na+/H+ antiporter MnhG subunit